MKRHIIVLLCLTFVTACTQYTLVDNKRQNIGGAYSVNPGIQWSKRVDGKVELWTIDGPVLQAIRFYQGLEDGDSLWDAQAEEKAPKFRSDMRANAIMELVVDSLSRLGAGQVDAENLRPMHFGSWPGFRFDLNYLTKDGLAKSGLVAGAVVEGKLYLILYDGTRSYYFPKYIGNVESILTSIEQI